MNRDYLEKQLIIKLETELKDYLEDARLEGVTVEGYHLIFMELTIEQVELILEALKGEIKMKDEKTTYGTEEDNSLMLAERAKEKRELIKEMAREIYIYTDIYVSIKDAVRLAKDFYNNIELELDRAFEKGGEE